MSSGCERARVIAADLGISAADESLWLGIQRVRRLLLAYGVEAYAAELPFVFWGELS